MKAKKIHHIGIVVPDLEAAKHLFGELLGMDYDHEESSDVWNVKAAFYRCGESLIEVMEPTGPGVDQDFLDRTGGGIHHVCYEIDDADQAYAELSRRLRVEGDGPQPGNSGSRIFFLNAEDTFHIETELLEPGKAD